MRGNSLTCHQQTNPTQGVKGVKEQNLMMERSDLSVVILILYHRRNQNFKVPRFCAPLQRQQCSVFKSIPSLLHPFRNSNPVRGKHCVCPPVIGSRLVDYFRRHKNCANVGTKEHEKAPNFAARRFVSTSDVRCDGPCCCINKFDCVMKGVNL